jgi:hypothetical protein
MSISAELQVINNFGKIARSIPAAITEGLESTGKHIVDLASQLAPEETGELKQSGDSQVVNGDTLEVSFGNGLNDDRATAQELGTIYFAAQPYLLPAARQIDATTEIAKAIKSKLI